MGIIVASKTTLIQLSKLILEIMSNGGSYLHQWNLNIEDETILSKLKESTYEETGFSGITIENWEDENIKIGGKQVLMVVKFEGTKQYENDDVKPALLVYEGDKFLPVENGGLIVEQRTAAIVSALGKESIATLYSKE